MNTTTKAVKQTIKLAGLTVDVFQMPDGHYELSQTSTTGAIDKARNSLLDFRGSKRPEALAYKDLTLL
jgi:hypothetical protein